jgi:FAD/FMN-containing dehydrogenase
VCREWDSRPPSLSQIKAAIAVLDPNDYADWDKVVSLTVALSKGKGLNVDALKRLVVEFSDRGDEDRRAGNDKTQYSPQARFDTWQPSVSPSVAAATLFASARDRAASIYRHAAQVGNFKGTRPAWSYLAAYHPNTWNELRAEMEATA